MNRSSDHDRGPNVIDFHVSLIDQLLSGSSLDDQFFQLELLIFCSFSYALQVFDIIVDLPQFFLIVGVPFFLHL